MRKHHQRVAAYVDLDAVAFNFQSMKENLAEGTMITAVIKMDGYGHGAVPIALLMEAAEYLWGFAVATMEEAMALREAGICKPILILGYVFPDAYPDMVTYDIRPTVFRLEMAEELSREAVRQGKKLPVHIKVDTGMSRIGFADTKESVETVQRIQALPGIEMEGLFTHFARADEADKTSAKKQTERFRKFADACRKAGIEFPIYHCANSAGIIDLQGADFNMVRAGIASYGLYPSGEVNKGAVALKPAMELKSHIVFVKEIEEGTEVSYGGIYKAPSRRRLATIPVGYGDGYPRSLSNKGWVLINGKKAPICGRICMDQLMVDVTDIPEAEIGMEVTLAGRDHGSALTIDELSELSGRFNYEFICDINKRVPRIYTRGGRIVEIREEM